MLKAIADLKHAIYNLRLWQLAIIAHQVVNKIAAIAILAQHIAKLIV
jgi:hypothetical protein